jgi:hypothetical protein
MGNGSATAMTVRGNGGKAAAALLSDVLSGGEGGR